MHAAFENVCEKLGCSKDLSSEWFCNLMPALQQVSS